MSFKNKILFFSPSGPRLTGQELASQLILELLRDEMDFNFRIIKLASYDREKSRWPWHWLQFVFSTLKVCYQMAMTIVNRNSVIYLNLSQSMKSLLLEGVPFGISGILNSRRRSVVSLHGHLFMEWSPQSIKGILFRWVLARSNKVTVLGLSQKEKLIEWGLPQKKIQIVNNTCEEIIEDLQEKKKPTNVINLLYLGNIMKAKGYREYLIAVLLLSQMNLDRKVKAIICGQFTKTSVDKRENMEKAIAWTNNIINRINDSSNVYACWIRGAYGAEKARVFSEADILLFPSCYRVEAQPIVLIEGMAARCAIIASSVGEMPAMLADGAGECLNNCSPENITKAILNLINNPQKLLNKQKFARRRYESQFSRGVYADTWKGIFQDLCHDSVNSK